MSEYVGDRPPWAAPRVVLPVAYTNHSYRLTIPHGTSPTDAANGLLACPKLALRLVDVLTSDDDVTLVYELPQPPECDHPGCDRPATTTLAAGDRSSLLDVCDEHAVTVARLDPAAVPGGHHV